MICLAMDTAGDACAACLYDGARDIVLAEKSEEIGRGHAEHLMGIVSDVMAAAGIGYGDLDRIVTTTGPGSFTGIRVGVATARGFGLGLGIPVIGISNLEGLAEATREKAAPGDTARFGAMIDARRGQVYAILDFATGLADANTPFLAEEAEFRRVLQDTPLPEGACRLVLGIAADGDFDPGLQALHVETIALGDVSVGIIARLGAHCVQDDHRPEPLYLRQADAVPQKGFAVERAG